MSLQWPPERPSSVEFFFDPMCPYAYQSSLWMRTVRDATGTEIRWRFCSLEEINREEGKKHPWERPWSYGWSQMRIGARLRRDGQDVLDRWYAAVGRAFHEQGRPTHEPEVHRALLAELGLAPELLDEAIADPSTSDEVLADHRVAAESGSFGVPTILLPDGRAVYGPVVVPAPVGEEALDLWDVTLAFTGFEHLYELKRPKTARDLELIAERFEPYLRARAWRTIENPAP
ncbi:MAG: DsbA family protein [Acidimicrobiales bacterium]|jgi:2-hydroxychromene-2-carboxylate isomerase|nr:DsbA family protein [Acidimicrobiales bacterium]